MAMNTTAHASYAFLTYAALSWFAWQIAPTGAACFWVMFFGIFPDLDGVYWKLARKGDMDQNFQHHLHFPTHFPVTYLPVVAAFALSLALGFYPWVFAVPLVGLYAHMAFDSISCGDGLMWAKIPWKKDQFARYVNLWSRQTDGYHGGYWTARYKRTIFFKLENVAAAASIVLIAYFSSLTGWDAWSLLSILGLAGSVAVSLKRGDPKFEGEPPEGRYADYHQYEPYVKWYRSKYGRDPPRKYDDETGEK
ncbi:MAG: hypothetical protein Kow0069_00100 [Promethearchaeota archaeon]